LQGQSARCLAELSALLEENPTYAAAYHNRGLLHLEAGDEAAAVADFRAALRCQPDHQQARQQLAALLPRPAPPPAPAPERRPPAAEEKAGGGAKAEAPAPAGAAKAEAPVPAGAAEPTRPARATSPTRVQSEQAPPFQCPACGELGRVSVRKL